MSTLGSGAAADRPAGVLTLCGSRKPAPGVDRPSAARQLLEPVRRLLTAQGVATRQADLRNLDLPHFDGRTVEAYGCADLSVLSSAVREVRHIVLSVPAYWGMPSGPCVNALQLLGGANYDDAPDAHPLVGRRIYLLVVGADEHSAHSAVNLLRAALPEYGVLVDPVAVTVGNIRRLRDRAPLSQGLRHLAEAVLTNLADEETRPAAQVRSSGPDVPAGAGMAGSAGGPR